MVAITGYFYGRRARPRSLALTTASATLALLAVSAPPAEAHTDLIGSTPTAGSVTTRQPSRVTLTFSEAVEPSLSTLSLDVDGRSLGRLSPSIGSQPGTLVALMPDTALGLVEQSSWTVGYRVTSVDGHPITGTVEFEVAAAPPPPSPNSTATPSDPASALDSGTGDGSTAGAADAAADSTATTTAGDDRGQTWWVPVMVLLLVILGAVAALRLGRTSPEAHETDPEPGETTAPSEAGVATENEVT